MRFFICSFISFVLILPASAFQDIGAVQRMITGNYQDSLPPADSLSALQMDMDSLVNDIRQVVNAFQSEISKTSRNMRIPLERPAVVSISLATTEIDETPIPDDAIALKRK